MTQFLEKSCLYWLVFATGHDAYHNSPDHFVLRSEVGRFLHTVTTSTLGPTVQARKASSLGELQAAHWLFSTASQSALLVDELFQSAIA